MKWFEKTITPKELASKITTEYEDHLKQNVPVRLIACKVGKDGKNGYAKKLADLLSVDVIAPTSKVRGNIITDKLELTGPIFQQKEWRVFSGGKK